MRGSAGGYGISATRTVKKWSILQDTPLFCKIRNALQLQPFRPGLQLRLVQAAAQHPAIYDLGAGGTGAQSSRRLAQAAAAGGSEEHDGLTSEVIGLQEGTVSGGIHPTQKPVELCEYFIKT